MSKLSHCQVIQSMAEVSISNRRMLTNIVGKQIITASSLVLISLLVPCSCKAEEGRDDNSVISSLNSAIDTWRENIRFQASYKYYHRYANGLDLDQFGDFGKQEEESPLLIGFIAKDNEMYRLKVDYGKPPLDASLSGSGTLFTNVSFDEVLSTDLLLSYSPKYEDFGNHAVFNVRPEMSRGTFKGFQSTDAVLSAFSFGGGVDGGPLRKLHSLVGKDDSWVQQIISKDHGRCVVQLIWSNDKGMTHERKVTFWTEPSVPVVELVEDHYVDKRRGLETKSITKGIDFVDCKGGMLASRVIGISTLPSSGPSKPPRYLATIWLASEITSDVSSESFEITVPKDTEIKGLNSAPSTKSGPVTLRLAGLSRNDIQLTPGPVQQFPTKSLKSDSMSYTRIAGIVVTSIIVVILIALIVIRRSSIA
jgi:hypothetical protein